MSFVDLVAVASVIETAASPEALFGSFSGSKDEQLLKLKNTYRQLAGVVHPDKHTDEGADRAEAAFVRATELFEEAKRRIGAGIYGHVAVASPKAEPAPGPAVITVKSVKYVVEQPAFGIGEISDVYRCRYGEHQQPAALKLSRTPKDNDLLQNEAKVLKTLYPADKPDEKYYRYFPKLLDSFLFRSTRGTNRQANVLTLYEGYYSLAEVLAVYPKGLNYRDVVWMYRRMLVGLGYAHRQGFVHGAVLPANTLIHPTEHGARLLDWCFSVPLGKQKIPAVSKTYKSLYAPEVLARSVATAATDIYMATATAVVMLGGDPDSLALSNSVPAPLQGFLKACLLKAPSKRPQDAWQLHDELDELLFRVVGKPKYRALTMPSSARA